MTTVECCPTCNRPLPRALAGYAVDMSRNQLLINGGFAADLTSTEAEILAALIDAKSEVLSRLQLIDALYGQSPSFADERTIDSFIKRLRKKLASTSLKIVTVYGRGYFAEVTA